jgi:DNA-binding transcriptional LysR family regulator
MELLDSRRLRHFLAVYDLRSIGQAAEKLYVTQPALSKSIRQLEEDLGVQLFDRTPLGVVPTVFGETLAQHARIIRAEMRHAETELANLRGAVKGHVTVGVGPSIAAYLMPLATQRVRQSKPGISLTVVEGLSDTLIPALRRGEIDFAVGTWPRVADGDLTAEVIVRDRVSVVAGPDHPLAGRRDVPLADLLDYPWILPPETQRWRQILEETFLAEGLAPPVPAVSSNSASFIRMTLLDQKSLSYLPAQTMHTRSQTTSLVAIEAPGLTRPVDVTVSYRERTRLAPATQVIIAALTEVAHELTEKAADAERSE